MSAPKKPQDHKAKVEKAKETDIVVEIDGEEVTVRGYQVTVGDRTIEVEKDVIQSWEFAEAASGQDIVRLARVILGDSYASIRDSFKDSRGRASTQEIADFINGVIEAFPNS